MHHFVIAGADEAGDADDLACASCRLKPETFGPLTSSSETLSGPSGRTGARIVSRSTARPTISRTMSALRALRVSSVPARRPSRSTVARSVISITSSMSCETKMTLAPRRTRLRTSVNSFCTSAAGRKGVGSSRMRSCASAAGSPQLPPGANDRKLRPLDGAELLDRRLAGRGPFRSAANSARAAAACAASRSASDRRWHVADEQVLQHRHGRDEAQMLVHEGDAKPRKAPGGSGSVTACPADAQHCARVRLVEARPGS